VHIGRTYRRRSLDENRKQEELMSTRRTSTRKTLVTAAIAAVLAGGAVGGVALAGDLDRGPGGAAQDRPSAAMVGMSGMGMSAMSGMGMSGMAVEDEFGYLTMMIPHHEEAIRNGQLLLAGSDRPEMRAFATSIIETQSREVEQMRGWLASWYAGRGTAVNYTPMMRDLTGLRGDALDRAFLTDMIPHHMGAVMMSQQLLGQGLAAHTELEPFARTVRDAQYAEIVQMRGWLADWFGATGMGHGAVMWHR
jgi:uncharacterized protein (DUF305 family)